MDSSKTISGPVSMPKMRNRLDYDEIFLMGRGHSYAHNGELLQGMFETSPGVYLRGLVSLPCPIFETHATFIYGGKNSGLRVYPAVKAKARYAAKITLTYLGKDVHGDLKISSTIIEKAGMGSSTADVKATVDAVTNAFGVRLPDQMVARICVYAEQASDPLMFSFEKALLFGHRSGEVLEDLGTCPALAVIGFNTDNLGNGISTLDLQPAEYNWRHLEEFRVLRARLRRAVATNDPNAIGQVALRSAEINQSFLANPKFEFAVDLVKRVGAAGLAIAHSGTVGAILLPHDLLSSSRIQSCQRYLEAENLESWVFTTANRLTAEVM